MAGYEMGFDDGGAIPDDDQDPTGESGPAPQAAATPEEPDQTGESGPAPQAAQPQQEEDPGGARLQGIADAGKQTPMEGARQFPGNLKRIVSYLMGDGAAEPEAAKKFQLGVRHEYPGINPDDVNVLSVHKAMELGGPGAAWGMIQFNRKSYDAKQSFANAAMTGAQGKPPDAHAAADAATKASQNVLDGSQAHFTADDQGFITATVKLPGTDTPQTYRLSPEQFQQYTNVGQDGQYDKLMELGGVPGTLQRIVGQPGKGGALSTQGAGDAESEPTAPPPPGLSANEKKVQATGKSSAVDPSSPDADQPGATGMYDKTGRYLGPREPDLTNYGPELEARADARFGKGSINGRGERQQWMADQEDKELERQNKLDQATEKGKLANERARITGTGKVEQEKVRQTGQNVTAGTKVEGAKAVQADKGKNYSERTREMANAAAQKALAAATTQDEKNRINRARIEMNDPNTALRKPGDVDAIFKKWGANVPLQVPTQAPQAQGGQQQQGNDQDQQALLWAKANPNDPRAAKILQHLGQ